MNGIKNKSKNKIKLFEKVKKIPKNKIDNFNFLNLNLKF